MLFGHGKRGWDNVLPDNLQDWISKQQWCNNDYLKKTAATMAKPGSSAHFICHESYT